ncbi:VWA domain-containing protein [Aliiglaciecola litoralis]|uniref:VWFA domain-containing protein n=1 Tax=Aliiglaciecola litoralis TaxID=582857 RepID=A0ABP3WPW3_9ALTE
MIDFNLFHFLRPEWFWALIPMAVLLVLAALLHRNQSGWQGVLPAHLYRHLVTSQGIQKRRPPLSLVAIAWLIAVTALAGPTWQQLPQPVYQLNAGKVVLIDMSMSMRATDLKPDRLTLAKYKAIDLINEIAEGDVGLVAYAGDAFRISPLSADAQNLTTLLPSLSPEIMPVAGSDPALGIKMAAKLLNAAGYFEGDIYWITDGVEMSQLAELNEMLESLPYRISILGVGTAEGAPIQLLDGDFLKDSRGGIVIPKMNQQLLAGLARKSGGKYTNLSVDDTDINYLVDQQLLEREADQSKTNNDRFGDQWQEDGPYLLLLLLPLAAFAFRRGYIVVIMLTLMSSSMLPTQVQAAQWSDWFKNDDQQAKEAFEQQQYAEAAQQFNDPLWQGAALYRSEDYAAAVDAFSKIDTPQGWYNKGNALAQLGELDKAIEAYNKVLDTQPEHEDALRNKALLEELKKQQEQQQQQNTDSEQNQQQDQNQDSNEGQSEQQDQQTQQQNSDQQDSAESQQSQNQQDQSQQQDSPEQQGEQDQDQESQSEQQQQNEGEAQQSDAEEQQAQAQQAEVSEQPLTDEEREQMQRLENLLKKVPDDPAFLLKRKMMLENQQRRRERAPSQTKRTW